MPRNMYTKEEDEIILREWNADKENYIANAMSQLPHRSHHSIRLRCWIVRNNLQTSYEKHSCWSEEEDKVILNAYSKHDRKYASRSVETLHWRTKKSIYSRIRELKRMGVI